MSYALVNVKTSEISQTFGAIPNPLVWPNGDASHGVALGEERSGYRFVAVQEDGSKPGEFYDGDDALPQLTGATVLRAKSWVPMDLDEVKAILVERINAWAENERLKYITAGSGQAMIYLAKLAEAKAFVNDPSPKDGNYPLLAASAVAPATIADAARTVTETAAAWTAIGAEIERVRFQTKAAIAVAKTVDEASAAAVAFNR